MLVVEKPLCTVTKPDPLEYTLPTQLALALKAGLNVRLYAPVLVREGALNPTDVPVVQPPDVQVPDQRAVWDVAPDATATPLTYKD